MKAEEPIKVGISMITYKHGAYIRRALDSILAQEVNFRYELVIGEDCSNDGTREILLEYQARYPDRIVLLLNDENLGASRNSYQVQQRLRGQYTIGCEGDDFWIGKDKLQKQVDFLDLHPEYVAVATNVVSTDSDGRKPCKTLYAWQVNKAYQMKHFLRYGMVLGGTSILKRNIIPNDTPQYKRLQLSVPTMGDVITRCLLYDKGPIFVLPDVTHAHRSGADTPTSFHYSSRTKSLEYTKMYQKIVEELNFYFDYRYNFYPLLSNRIAAALMLSKLSPQIEINRAESRAYLKSLPKNVVFSARLKAVQKLFRKILHKVLRPVCGQYPELEYLEPKKN